MGVFEFLTIGIVTLSVGSVLKAWIKHRGAALRLAEMERKLLQLEAARVEDRLGVLEEIVTGVDLKEGGVDAQFRRLEKGEAYKQLPA